MGCRGGELRGVSTGQWIDVICLIRLKITGWARAFDLEWRLLSPAGERLGEGLSGYRLCGGWVVERFAPPHLTSPEGEELGLGPSLANTLRYRRAWRCSCSGWWGWAPSSPGSSASRTKAAVAVVAAASAARARLCIFPVQSAWSPVDAGGCDHGGVRVRQYSPSNIEMKRCERC